MNITPTTQHNGTSLPTTPSTTQEATSGPITYFFFTYYALVFISGSVGNVVIIASVAKYKRMKTVVNIFLVNLALSDLLFVVLSIFDGVAFIADGKWLLGDAFCRIQGTMIEISYTVSVCTLTVVAAERYISICHPHRTKRTFQQAYNTCVFVWLFSIVFCSSLFYGYTASPNEDGDIVCRNNYWPSDSRLSFYIVHSILVYMVPLAVMCFSHWFISKALIRQKMRTFSTYSSSIDQITKDVDETDVNKNESQANQLGGKLDGKKEWKRNVKQANKRMKVVRLLLVVTIVFFVLWTPFIVVRLLKYFTVEINELLWRGTQLLIFGNTAVNCYIYALMSPAFREAFKGIFCCEKRVRHKNYSTSRSFDISETVKRKTSLNNKVVFKV